MQKYILGILLFLLIVGNAYGQDNNNEIKYFNMGNAYGDKGNYDKAIEYCKKAIEINPNLAEAYYNIGLVYLGKKREMTAADYLYRAGVKCLEQDKKQGVLKTLDAMKTYVPNSPLVKKLYDKLYNK